MWKNSELVSRDESHLNEISMTTDSPISAAKCSELFELDGKAIVPFPRQLRVDKEWEYNNQN